MTKLLGIYKPCECHEKEKRRQYEQRVHEVEHGHFTPLVFTTTEGMGDPASQVYKKIS